MTALSSYHSCSQRPEEKKEGKVGERKGMRRPSQLSHFLLRPQHLLKFLVDVRMRVGRSKGVLVLYFLYCSLFNACQFFTAL